jgi:hypothetical protein
VVFKEHPLTIFSGAGAFQSPPAAMHAASVFGKVNL